MKLIKILFLILVWSIGVVVTYPQMAFAEITTITVEINELKANEKEWDIWKGAPDLAICLTNPLVGTLCLPDGDRVELISTAQCADSFRCKFSADIPDGTFKISIVDVDAVLNDIIGIGHCRKGETCEVGEAKVKIKESGNQGWWFK
ncbi:hypothetical protein [Phormidium sp. CCY1219]|uniref:hypothetical protein n=1 Tax=Phormidium sp. CCY1219 TaxID=2886104 RepID=UPI002D1EE3B7|nr:hypothetical protein [Phormidium sp. CCY1219]MEB3827031.1 hypothetical protein [Phormidium sp. CCY1219]